MQSAVDAFDGFTVRACPECGCREPAFGWMAGAARGPVYYLHCPMCGQWAEGEGAAAAVTVWNGSARRAEKMADLVEALLPFDWGRVYRRLEGVE